MIITAIVDDYEVTILHEGDYQACYLVIRNIVLDSVIEDSTFDNAILLSATLRDHIGLENAILIMEQSTISPNSTLWDFNHSPPHDLLPFMARDDLYLNEEIKPSDEYFLIAESGWSSYEEVPHSTSTSTIPLWNCLWAKQGIRYIMVISIMKFLPYRIEHG